MSAATVRLWFHRLYQAWGMSECSSHSGRRTFITRVARKVSEVGGSMRDVQPLAGHASMQTTQRYIKAIPTPSADWCIRCEVSNRRHVSISPKNAEKPRPLRQGWLGVGHAGLNAQEPTYTHAGPEPSMGEGAA